jgi:hypothetical protein
MKIDLGQDKALLFNEITRLLGLAPLLVMIAAVLMLVVTVFTVKDFIQREQIQRQRMELPQFKVSIHPVGGKLYEDYAATLARLSPTVDVKGSKEGLEVSISDPSHYPEFMFVLNSVQGLSKNVVWKAEEICLAGCTGKSALAKIKGQTEKVEVNLRGEEHEQQQ